MQRALDVLDRLLDIWSRVKSWRVILCAVVAIATIFIAGRLGRDVGEGSYALAVVIGLLVGAVWEHVTGDEAALNK